MHLKQQPQEFTMQSSPNSQTSVAAPIGRVLIAAVFLVSGFAKLAEPAATQGYIASVGMPVPILAYLAAVVIELGGALLLVLGYRLRYVSLILGAYCIVTALVFHNAIADQNQLFHLLKNFGLAGGLLFVFEFGAGLWSLDAMHRSSPSRQTLELSPARKHRRAAGSGQVTPEGDWLGHRP